MSRFVRSNGSVPQTMADGGAMDTSVLRALLETNEPIDSGALAKEKGWEHAVLVGVVKSLAAHEMVEAQVRTRTITGPATRNEESR